MQFYNNKLLIWIEWIFNSADDFGMGEKLAPDFTMVCGWGGGLLCQERPLCNLKIIKWSQDVTLIPPIGLKSKDLEAFKFLYQEYDKDNKWQSENTGLSSFLKQEARQTAFWYIFKLWSWLHFIMKKINVPFFKAEAKKVHAIVSSLHPICGGLY